MSFNVILQIKLVPNLHIHHTRISWFKIIALPEPFGPQHDGLHCITNSFYILPKDAAPMLLKQKRKLEYIEREHCTLPRADNKSDMLFNPAVLH